MRRKNSLYPLFLFILTIMIASCRAAPATDSDSIKVGAIFDLSGATSDVGTPYAEGMQGYVKWLNDQGGVEGRQIELIFQDYAYEVPRAEQLYSQFVQEGVVAFMGWGTGDTEALRGRIADDEMPFMSASYSHVLGDPTEAPYNFLVGTSYSDQFFIAVDWAIEDWAAKGNSGMPVVAFLHHPSPFGLSPWEQGGQAYTREKGINATAYQMPPGVTDYTAELTRIQQAGAKYVIVQTVSSPASTAIKDARRLGMSDVTFVCLNWCADEIMINLAGDAAEGVVGAMPFTPPGGDQAGLKQVDDYLKSQGSSLEAKGLHYSQAWWTMAVMTEGLRRVIADGQEVNGANLRRALEGISNFDTGGVTVPITFTADDHLGSKGMRLFRVENGTWQPLTDFMSVK
jgi:branched-chain amino acid transport system substrate-binding protein